MSVYKASRGGECTGWRGVVGLHGRRSKRGCTSNFSLIRFILYVRLCRFSFAEYTEKKEIKRNLFTITGNKKGRQKERQTGRKKEKECKRKRLIRKKERRWRWE
jgi:hypothetical protein